MSKHCTLLTNTARFFSDLPLGGTGLTKPNAHCTAHWVNIPSPKGGTLQRLLFSSCGISSRFLLLYLYFTTLLGQDYHLCRTDNRPCSWLTELYKNAFEFLRESKILTVLQECDYITYLITRISFIKAHCCVLKFYLQNQATPQDNFKHADLF